MCGVVEGLRPSFPAGTPSWYADLASACWANSARQRCAGWMASEKSRSGACLQLLELSLQCTGRAGPCGCAHAAGLLLLNTSQAACPGELVLEVEYLPSLLASCVSRSHHVLCGQVTQEAIGSATSQPTGVSSCSCPSPAPSLTAPVQLLCRPSSASVAAQLQHRVGVLRQEARTSTQQPRAPSRRAAAALRAAALQQQ